MLYFAVRFYRETGDICVEKEMMCEMSGVMGLLSFGVQLSKHKDIVEIFPF